MKLPFWAVLIAGLALGLVAGCGGGGGGGGTSGSGGTTSQASVLTASVNLNGTNPSNLQVVLDGQPVDATISSDGAFSLQGVPSGSHVLDVVTRDGLRAGRAICDVQSGTPTTVPPISLTGTGEIAGTVQKKDADGTLEPLANVEVVARGNMAIMMRNGQETLAPEGDTSTTTLVWPPPPAVSYSAFTDDTGAYTMKGVAAGNYLVAVLVPGMTARQAFVSVEDGQTTTCDFTLSPIVEPGVGTVKGTVQGETSTTNATPNPIAGAVVRVIMSGAGWEPPASSTTTQSVAVVGSAATAAAASGSGSTSTGIAPAPILLHEFRTLTDAKGQYSLNVPAGEGKIVVWAPGYEPTTADLTLKAGDVAVKDFVLKILDIVPPSPPTSGSTSGGGTTGGGLTPPAPPSTG